MSSLFIFSLAQLSCETPPMDLAIVIDQTKSVGEENYDKMMESIRMLISKYKVGPDNDHVAIVTFAGQAKVRANLDDPKYHSISGLNDLITEMEHNDVLGSPTRTDIALDLVNKEVFTEANGDRPDSPDILIVFTDGGKHETSQPYSAVLPPLVVSQSEYKI